jgi:hypothetical protein
VRYALLIYKDERDWDALGESGQAEVMQGHAMTAQRLSERGMIRGGEPLQSVATATTVRVRNGETLATDGPFAETKEQLAGFYLIECDDLDQAIEAASKVPDAAFGSVEVRPVQPL